MRRLLEKDILIRLTENGFVETTRYFGLLKRSSAYETAAGESMEDSAGDERLQLARVRPRFGENRRYAG
jgi:hypothetical protein